MDDPELDRQQAVEEERQRQIDLLMAQVEQKKDDNDFNGAVQVLRQVLVIDPNNAQAEWLMDMLVDIASVRQMLNNLIWNGLQACLSDKQKKDHFVSIKTDFYDKDHF